MTSAEMPTIKELHWFDEPLGKPGKYQEKFLLRWEKIKNQQEQHGHPLPLHHRQTRDRAAFKTDQDYRNFFATYCAPDSVFGDVTPSYCTLTEAEFKRIKLLFPKVRFVFLIRNPADRLWSELNMQAQRLPGYDLQAELARQLAADRLNIKGNYHRTFEAAVSAIGRENIFVAFHENLFGEQQKTVLAQLCQFLQIREHGGDRERLRDNRRTYHAMTRVERDAIIKKYMGIYHWAEETFGQVPEIWKEDLTRIQSAAIWNVSKQLC